MTINSFLTDPADLSQLRITDPARITNLIHQLQPHKNKKQFIVIGTGGTLSMKENHQGVRVPDLDVDAILSHLDPAITKSFAFLGLDAFHLDSAQFDYHHVHDLAIIMSHIWTFSPVPIAGFLILHGTDTLAYSGAALSLMMGQGLPFSIVMTAAQKPIQMPLNDAAQNITNAIYTLDALHSADMAEVISVMGDYAFLSSSAIKIHDLHVNALTSPIHPPVADFTQLHYPLKLAPWLNPRRAHVDFQPTIWGDTYGHSLIIKSHLGLSPALIKKQIMDEQIRAVLLYSYGAGTVYNGIIDSAIKGCSDKKCPLFVVSPVYSSYKTVYSSAKDIIDRGAIALHMTLPAALAKIEIALRLYDGDLAKIATFMQNNYVGEIPPHA